MKKTVIAAVLMSAFSVCTVAHAADANLEDRLSKIEGMDRFQNYTLEAYKKEIENNKTIATNAQNNAAHAIIKNSEQDSSIEANKQSIEKNTAGIAANKQSIEKNTADIAANKEAIKFNHETNIRQDQDIQSNKVAISNNRQAIQNVAHQVDALKSRVDDLSDETYKGLAAQAALSGLFQPYSVGKFNVTAALGGYKSEQAVAIGSGYRFNENVAVKAAVASDVGFDAVSYNVGVNFEW